MNQKKQIVWWKTVTTEFAREQYYIQFIITENKFTTLITIQSFNVRYPILLSLMRLFFPACYSACNMLNISVFVLPNSALLMC